MCYSMLCHDQIFLKTNKLNSTPFPLTNIPQSGLSSYDLFSLSSSPLVPYKSKSTPSLLSISEGRMKLRSKRLFKGSSKNVGGGGGGSAEAGSGGDIEWEMRPGGMLVQKREVGRHLGEGLIQVRASTGSKWHDISIGATSTFGELKMVLSLVTGLEPREQRILFRGKEREDSDHLHMVGVRDSDRVLLLEDPAIKEKKLHALTKKQFMGSPCHTIKV